MDRLFIKEKTVFPQMAMIVKRVSSRAPHPVQIVVDPFAHYMALVNHASKRIEWISRTAKQLQPDTVLFRTHGSRQVHLAFDYPPNVLNCMLELSDHGQAMIDALSEHLPPPVAHRVSQYAREHTLSFGEFQMQFQDAMLDRRRDDYCPLYRLYTRPKASARNPHASGVAASAPCFALEDISGMARDYRSDVPGLLMALTRLHPASALQRFRQWNRKRARLEHPDLNLYQIDRLLYAQWQALTNQEKALYNS